MMNHKNISQRLLSFLFVVLFLYSCADDDFQNRSDSNHKNVYSSTDFIR